MEPNLLAWLGTELYTNEAPGVRRRLVASQASYQDVMLNLALTPRTDAAAAGLAATIRGDGVRAHHQDGDESAEQGLA